MHVRSLLIAAVSLAVLTPAVSNAAPESAALKTCTAAFASSFSVQGGASPTVKLNYRAGQASDTFAEYYTHDYTFFLSANDPKSGAALARATCSATTGGTLLSFSATSLATDRPALAARL
jgi:hypothetical protein